LTATADIDNMTPLYWAVDGNFINIVNILLKKDDIDANLASNDGFTPYSLAVRKNYSDIVPLIYAKVYARVCRILGSPL